MSSARRIECDVAVVGAGPAGLAAAAAACEAGAEDVLLLERDTHLGGILQQCIHNGFGLSYFGEDLTGPEYAQRLIDGLDRLPVRTLVDTMVLSIDHGRAVNAVSAREGMLDIRPESVVLAMGCRERTRGALATPGSRPAGIMTAGQAQRFINIDGYLPGREVVILGSGDIGMIMARRLHLEGCAVRGVIEMNECIGGLTRNLVQCLHDFSIPLYLNHTVVDIHGQERIGAVDVAPVLAGGVSEGVPDMARAFCLECDLLLLSVGLIPENELSVSAGVELDPRTSGPMVDQDLATGMPGVFAAGNVVQVFDLVDHVSVCGDIAGAAAAEYARGGSGQAEGVAAAIVAAEGVRTLTPQRIHVPDDGRRVRLYLRAAQTMRPAVVQLVDRTGTTVAQWRHSVVRPPEMITADVAPGVLAPAESYHLEIRGREEIDG